MSLILITISECFLIIFYSYGLFFKLNQSPTLFPFDVCKLYKNYCYEFSTLLDRTATLNIRWVTLNYITVPLKANNCALFKISTYFLKNFKAHRNNILKTVCFSVLMILKGQMFCVCLISGFYFSISNI